MAERKPLSKKIRFEVFKRDKFTCQYCGRMAPDVVLEVDHMKPVSKGGTNDIMNLITSCYDCNRGKRDKELSDDTVVKKQQAQLLELSERKEQLEMMLEWRNGLEEINEQAIGAVLDYMAKRMDLTFASGVTSDVEKWVSEFNINDIFDAIDIAIRQYYKDAYDVNYTLSKIPGICNNRSKGQSRQKYYFNYLRKASKNKFGYYNESVLSKAVFTGANKIDNDEKFEIAKGMLCEVSRWDTFSGYLYGSFIE